MAVNINYSLSRRLGELLTQQNKTVAITESCTGGGLSEEITAVSGCSSYFLGGLIAYSDHTKKRFLHVKEATLDKHGAASEAVAAEMVSGLLGQSEADIAISITGIAGPGGGTAEKPVGMVCFGLLERGKEVKTCTQYFTSGRKHVRRGAINFALKWMIEALEQSR